MNAPVERRLRVGDGLFDPLSGDLTLGGRTVRLRPRTAALLAHLVQHSDRAVSKEELMQAVWPDVVVTEASIVQCVKEIRQALGGSGREWIRTMPRHGYAFLGNAAAEPPAPGALPAAPSFRDLLKLRWRRLAVSLAVTLAVLLAFVVRELTSHGPATAAAPLSVIVLPLANLTGDPRHDATAEEMGEALADALARTTLVAVVAPSTARAVKGRSADPRDVAGTLGVRYAMEGSLREAEGGLVLKLRLLEAATALQLWNQEYQQPDMGELLRLVKTRAAHSFAFQVARAESRRANANQPPSPRARELYHQAEAIYKSSPKSRSDVARARALLEEAVRLDDDLVGAWTQLAVTVLENVRFSTNREADLQRAEQAIAQAVARAPDVSYVRMVEGMVLSEQRRVRDALVAYRRAVDLDPKNVVALGWEADALTMLGRPQEAFAPLERALQTDPRHSWVRFIHFFIGSAHVALAEDAQAISHLTITAEAEPQHPWPHIYLAAAFGNLGRKEEAGREVDQVLVLLPGFTISGFRAKELSNEPEFLRRRQHFYEGLRRAGFPE